MPRHIRTTLRICITRVWCENSVFQIALEPNPVLIGPFHYRPQWPKHVSCDGHYDRGVPCVWRGLILAPTYSRKSLWHIDPCVIGQRIFEVTVDRAKRLTHRPSGNLALRSIKSANIAVSKARSLVWYFGCLPKHQYHADTVNHTISDNLCSLPK